MTSYGSSYAIAYATVVAPQATATPAPTATPVVTQAPAQAQTDYTMTIVAMGIAAILAIVIVGAVLAVMFRKRP